MQKTVTVKGLGKISRKPDYALIAFDLDSRDRDYSKAIKSAEEKISALTESLTGAGFDGDEIKTVNFNVRSEYDSVRESDGGYKQVFVGYTVSHSLKLGFDFNSDRLGDALCAVNSSGVHPGLSVTFTVKNPMEIGEALLRSATENARTKAEILCSAAGESLGELICIEYSWGDVNTVSRTRYGIADECLAMSMTAKNIAFTPDDIEATDSATFVWSIG